MEGCLIVASGILLPRMTLLGIAIFTNWWSRAFGWGPLPVLGFVVAPYTTLSCMAVAICNSWKFEGGWAVLIVVAVLADLGKLVPSPAEKRQPA